ncbi:uncharacterized protein LOC126456652 [Schistocerca serialis cubense]|uniref:uncharacterized protein LOC126456652 n=1 Tax=Schistocerca serialis cubense TaxID=2023355 RepID=UPI00214E7920|nr:uncharacterized protein LOC126456652 [Schistocerca serialis cubense]
MDAVVKQEVYLTEFIQQPKAPSRWLALPASGGVLAVRRCQRPESLAPVAGVADCGNTTVLKECLDQVPAVLGEGGRGLPTSKDDLTKYCRGFKTGMSCIDSYSRCIDEPMRRLLDEQVAAARYFFMFLCDDPGFRERYLQYSRCYSTVSDDWDSCVSRFSQLVNEEVTRQSTSQAQRLIELCCAKYGFLQCVLSATRLRCQRQEALFLHRIAETLSTVHVYSPVCHELGGATCSAAAHTPTTRAATHSWLLPPVLYYSVSGLLLMTQNSETFASSARVQCYFAVAGFEQQRETHCQSQHKAVDHMLVCVLREMEKAHYTERVCE